MSDDALQLDKSPRTDYVFWLQPMFSPNRYRVILRGKLWGEFDWFHEAWAYATVYLTHIARIEDKQTKENWILLPPLS